MTTLQLLLLGAAATSCCGIAVFFFRYWRDTRDRFFLLFGLAFVVLGLNWLLLSTVQPDAEARPFFYLIRLLAFALILGAVWEKNRPSARRRPPLP